MKLFRGQSVIFEKALKDPEGNLLQPTRQIACRIQDPFGHVVSQGPATYNMETDYFEFRFIVPLEAPFSTMDSSWKLDWAFKLEDGRDVDIVVEFDVINDDAELPERTVIVAQDNLELVEFLLADKAETLQLEILDVNNKIIATIPNKDPFEMFPTESGYIYSLTFNSASYKPGDYLFRLRAKLANRRNVTTEFTLVRIVPNSFWFLYPSLQLFLDKVRKRSDMVQAYSKSDYYDGLCRGVAMLNITPPQMTNWTFTNFPLGGQFWGNTDFSHYLISAAALWLLQAQTIMHGELNFNFTGQTISLGYDAVAAIGGEINQLLDVVNDKFPKAKEMMLRQTQTPVVVGIRRQFHNQALSRLDTMRRALDVQLSYLNSPQSARYVM